jgi:Na+-driven multidrug efflux pump
MIVQTLYLLADLFWVGRLGKSRSRRWGAGNLTMIVLALTRCWDGDNTLISHAWAKDQPHAELAFNQSFVSILVAVGLRGRVFVNGLFIANR